MFIEIFVITLIILSNIYYYKILHVEGYVDVKMFVNYKNILVSIYHLYFVYHRRRL